MTPHTMLIVPPPGSDLLADEPGGGRVPAMTPIRCQVHGYAMRLPARGDHPGSALGYLCPACWLEKLESDAWGDIRFEPPALLLVWEGKPVPMGCDRAMRWCRAHPDREKPGIYYPQPRAFWTVALARDVADFARLLGCRIVALGDDGREVADDR